MDDLAGWCVVTALLCGQPNDICPTTRPLFVCANIHPTVDPGGCWWLCGTGRAAAGLAGHPNDWHGMEAWRTFLAQHYAWNVQDLTDIDYLRGWTVEFASTAAVLVATVLGLPVSTTHCQIYAVAAVGIANFGPREVSWGLIMMIMCTWMLVIPLSVGLAAGISAIARAIVI